MLIHANNAPYSPNTLNGGAPRQATQSEGRGFFTAPGRRVEGRLHRSRAKSLTADFYSQPRLFYNSLVPEEQQFLINAIRFETAHLKSDEVKRNVVNQLNKIHHRVAREVANVLAIPPPEPDKTFYHDNRTRGVSVFEKDLRRISGLKVGILATTRGLDTDTINRFKRRLGEQGARVVVVAETLQPGIDQTYATSDATDFDAVVVANGAGTLFQSSLFTTTSEVPAGRPLTILQDAYRFGKPIGFAGDASFSVAGASQIPSGPGVYHERENFNGNGNGVSSSVSVSKRAEEQGGGRRLEHRIEEGLRKHKFLNRFNPNQQQGGNRFDVSRNTTMTGFYKNTTAPVDVPEEAPVEAPIATE
jgi:catalase